jgi:hypothetical protein
MTEWRTVPAEPTEAMISAGNEAFRSYAVRWMYGAPAVWEAMLSAAPAPVALTDEVSRLTAERDALRAENGRLRESLTEAIKSVAAWGSFANEYEQDRYRLSDEIVRLSAALEATK